jgi:hypothetical protein
VGIDILLYYVYLHIMWLKWTRLATKIFYLFLYSQNLGCRISKSFQGREAMLVVAKSRYLSIQYLHSHVWILRRAES